MPSRTPYGSIYTNGVSVICLFTRAVFLGPKGWAGRVRVHALFVSSGRLRPRFPIELRWFWHVLKFKTVVAVDKHSGTLNDKTVGLLLGTRASSTSTPSFILPSNYSLFLSQNGSLDFKSDQDYYVRILEEKDDNEFRWYPMRISYSRRQRAVKLNEALHEKGYETYLHLQETPKDYFGNPLEGTHQGPVYSIIFVHAMKIQLKLLKRYAPVCHIMKFMIVPPRLDTQAKRIIWVPDRQMENFIDAATRPDPQSQRIHLTYNDFIDKQGKAVRIIDGPFTGVEGEIKRIGRHRIVVSLLREAQVAMGLTHIPPENLEFL